MVVASETTAGAREAPVFSWRGLGIDIVRHFFTVDDLLPIVDVMGDLGLNVLRIHLSDDQGWRLPVPAYPELTELSSGSAVDGDPGGSWTRDDWDRLKAHASARGIRLVPEFDMPSHVNAALHAIPGLNLGEPPETYTGIEVGFCSLSPDAPETERFMREVLTFAASIADGWVHIGGDEAHSTPREEYEGLVRRAVEIVHGAGARVVAWQEAADLLEAGDLVQVWDLNLDPAPVVRAASRGVGVIVSPAPRIYLDMKYDHDLPYGLDWMGVGDLRESLEWTASEVVPGLPEDAVHGVEASVWTENIRDRDQLSIMLLPRLAAAAEVAQHGSGFGRWEMLAPRVARMARDWEAAGLAYHCSPGVDWTE